MTEGETALATKFQIFVSSTYEDLVEERDAVIKAILEMGHIPVGMEMFSAADEQQWQIIQRHIDESDYYLVIVAHRYGSVVDGISYTRKEYEYAVASGVPALGFLIDPSASWPADRIDGDKEVRLLLDEFRGLVGQRPVGYWKSAEDLHSKAVVALMKAFTATPREGWVRSSSSIGPEVTSELSRLSAENARLRREIEALNHEVDADQTKAMQQLRAVLSGRTHDVSYRYFDSTEWETDAPSVSLRWIFETLGPSLIPEYPLRKASELLAIHLKSDQSRSSTITPLNVVKEVLVELMALDLVAPSSLRHSVSDQNEYWSLTQAGTDYLRWSKRRELEIKRPQTRSEETAATQDGPSGDKASASEGTVTRPESTASNKGEMDRPRGKS
ncbi:hypothetical protein J2X63_000733 [Agromyces sp. 3263]|uniref:DUF4062 domain-containing protein n=1 Tax=Agromyces sp. 3263 TaxID=2817750 RepID=UPI0028545EDE|nr:DUF4062 domain-containing protein [Agromyces sp. 3263]MDR6905047.1 hypothetical protein [Agromyces sp. 3263]